MVVCELLVVICGLTCGISLVTGTNGFCCDAYCGLTVVPNGTTEVGGGGCNGVVLVGGGGRNCSVIPVGGGGRNCNGVVLLGGGGRN